MPFPTFLAPVASDALPPAFDFTLSGDELVAVSLWASRFGPSPHGAFLVQCSFHPGGLRRWLVGEANVVAWLDFVDDAQSVDGDRPEAGAINVPFQFLKGVDMADVLGEGARFAVDAQAGTLSALIDDIAITTDLPAPPPNTVPPVPHPDRYAVVSALEVAAAIAALRFNPIGPAEEGLITEEMSAPLPFVSFTTGDHVARFRRDWSGCGHSAVEVQTAAWGETNLTASFYGEVVLRELYVADEMEGDMIQLGLFDDTPAVMVVQAGNWGMLVELGSDIVLRYRGEIETVLTEAGIAHEEDPYDSWNPVVAATVSDRRVDARLVRGSALHQSHVRLSSVVTGGVSWNPELAAEMNLWNDKWFDTKLVHVDGELSIVRDVPVNHLAQLPPAMLDLVEKSLIVSDVVGVFM